jgi:RNA polymerase sigma-70 factor (ECF subfamily)
MDPATERPGTQRDSVLAALRERIVAYAASRISRDAAEDLAQEVLLVIHEKYRKVNQPG